MKTKRFTSLTLKLTIWYIGLLSIIVLLAGLFLFQGFKERLVNDLDKVLMEIADDTDEKVSKRGLSWEDAIQKAETKHSSHQPFIQLVQIAEREKHNIEKITRSNQIPEDAFLLDTHLYYKADKMDIDDMVFIVHEEKSLSSSPLRVFLRPIYGPYILQVGVSMEDITGALSQLLIVMVVSGLILMIFASIGGSLIINKALQPVKSVVKTANEISADDLTLRIDAKNRNDEIGALVETFNKMIARLEKSVKKIRQFSGDVSHELRTPLTIIRGEIEVLLRADKTEEDHLKTVYSVLDSVLEESHRMEKIIDDLLFLSRVEALDKSKLNAKVQLEKVIARVIGNRRQSAANKGLEFESHKVKAAQVRGNSELLERMLTNVVDNAIRYTPSGGRVEVVLYKEQNAVKLEISDTGIGIPKESIPRIFDRFYVVDESRSREKGGSGLGLSIVKWVADNHHAEIEIKSQVDKGTTFLIEFPSA